MRVWNVCGTLFPISGKLFLVELALEKVFYLRYTVPEGMTVRFAADPEDAQEGEIVVVIDLAVILSKNADD